MIELSAEARSKETDEYRKHILEYLLQKTKKDPKVAAACRKPNKTLNGIVNYIRTRARGKAENGIAVINNLTVYSWAVKYLYNDALNYEECNENNLCDDFIKTCRGRNCNKSKNPLSNRNTRTKHGRSKKNRHAKAQKKQAALKDNAHQESPEETIRWFYRNFGVDE